MAWIWKISWPTRTNKLRITKNIQKLSLIIQELSNKINHLENQQIQYISKLAEQDSIINQLSDELRSQNISIQNNYQQEIETKIQELKDRLDEHENHFDSNIQLKIHDNIELFSIL